MLRVINQIAVHGLPNRPRQVSVVMIPYPYTGLPHLTHTQTFVEFKGNMAIERRCLLVFLRHGPDGMPHYTFVCEFRSYFKTRK